MQRRGFKVPLLIGGATTSKMHTAVKIAPQYRHPAVHVLDASRSVVVVSSLLDPNNKADYQSEINEEYEEMRKEHYESQDEKKYAPIAKARTQHFKIDWTKELPVAKPTFLGTKKFLKYPLAELLPYIDWNPFFAVWQIRGKYPNRNYPRIFDDAGCGAQAKKLFADAQAMIREIIKGNLLEARGIMGFYPVNAVGDDIIVFKDDERKEQVATFHTLRQQKVTEVCSPHTSLRSYFISLIFLYDTYHI
jgi:5-methyltetrahydrofolate--homocysteine methyltransferase